MLPKNKSATNNKNPLVVVVLHCPTFVALRLFSVIVWLLTIRIGSSRRVL